MDQVKIGAYLKELRKGKNLTQEQLAEILNVSNRTVSRWETGANLPDLSILVEMADYYDVDLRDIINGERKSDEMDTEIKDTLKQAAQYAQAEKQKLLDKVKKLIGTVLTVTGCFLIFSAFAVFTSDSSWGAIYSFLGACVVAAGVFLMLKKNRILITIGVFLASLICMIAIDFAGVCLIHQPPRFSYVKEYGADVITYHATFYTVKRYHHDTPEETYEICPGIEPTGR